MTDHIVKRNSDGILTENCKENVGVKIGSFDCTANCPHNQNTKKEIQEQAFDLKIVRCPKLQSNQLTIEM
ncbi:hypothetical protein D0817_20005 [Flavobacterium cupreum]|uniref:Uncharacterized protein n=1 Tax=Flavobacterium cupreum TaxID=2133766 RepID=A0A434A2S8_9FLAO|nr:hypothetical protein [Flavobacterium]RUT68646.1 hypothetical protein D0817_20005 [Flavobacterium cupreum]TDO67862.1 hypothetical protein EV143_1264 [Flavobacterium sp. P3160]